MQFSLGLVLKVYFIFENWNCHLDLEPFGSHWSPLYGEKSWSVFIKNLNFFSTEERMTWTSWMTWGWVNYQQKFF